MKTPAAYYPCLRLIGWWCLRNAIDNYMHINSLENVQYVYLFDHHQYWLTIEQDEKLLSALHLSLTAMESVEIREHFLFHLHLF